MAFRLMAWKKAFLIWASEKEAGGNAFTDIGCIKLKPDLHHRFEA